MRGDLPKVPGVQVLGPLAGISTRAAFYGLSGEVLVAVWQRDVAAIDDVGARAAQLRGMRHPNLLAVLDLVAVEGGLLVVSEHVRGRQLATLDPLPPAWVTLEMAVQALDGLRHAHAHGVAHGTLDGADLILCADGMVKIVGMGLSSLVDPATDMAALARALEPLVAKDDGALRAILARAYEGDGARFADLRAMQLAVVDQLVSLGGGGQARLCQWQRSLSTDGDRVVTEGDPTSTVEASRLTTEEPRLPVGERLGRYVVLECLGVGGMGAVYAVYDAELDRKIAVKLLRRPAGAASSQGQTRLTREAQAMARVSHPNVVPIYDVGVTDGRVFLAMEYVPGQTLRGWLQERRTPAETLRVLIEAGRGLSAAHRAGLVHRDFKPDNVLISDAGRVYVTDFGLARLAGDSVNASERTSPATISGTGDESQGSALTSTLTQVGAVVGTPAYMAPEQHRGDPPDARTDQFNFCVTLYEALYRCMPYEPVRAGDPSAGARPLREPPRDSDVPAWIWRALRPGLSARAEERHASLDELLALLARDPAAARRRALRWALVAALMLGALVAVRAASIRKVQLCQGAGEQLRDVWGDEVKRRTRDAFIATALPFASERWQSAATILADYAERWVAMRTDACEATRVRGDQSDEAMSLRMSCLDRARAEMEELTRRFARPDETVLREAAHAASSLPPISACADVARLRQTDGMPVDAKNRERIEALSTRLARTEAAELLADSQETRRDAVAIADEAEQLQALRVADRALYLAVTADVMMSDFHAAETDSHRCIFDAEGGGDAVGAARCYTGLIFISGFALGNRAGVAEIDAHARAFLTRAGGDPDIESFRLNHHGAIALMAGDAATAATQLQQAIDTREGAHLQDLWLANMYMNLALARTTLDGEPTIALAQRAVAIAEKVLGPNHPDLAMPLTALAESERAVGQLDAARADIDRARRMSEDPHSLAGALAVRGRVEQMAGQLDRALDDMNQSVIAFERIDPEFAEMSDVLLARGVLLLSMGRARAARDDCVRALAIKRKASGGAADPRALTLLGQVELTLGHTQPAVDALEQAEQLVTSHLQPHAVAARTAIALGCSLERLGRDRERAQQLVARGLAELALVHDPLDRVAIDAGCRARLASAP